MCFAASCEGYSTPLRLVEICSSISAGVNCTNGFAVKMPALLTSTSTWPYLAMACSNTVFAVSGRPTSPATPRKRPSAFRLAAAACSRSAERPVPTTL